MIGFISMHFVYRVKEESAFNTESSSVIKLNNGTVMYLREVTKYLALVCILREDSFKRQGKCEKETTVEFPKTNLHFGFFKKFGIWKFPVF